MMDAEISIDVALSGVSANFPTVSALEPALSHDCVLARSWFEYMDDCFIKRQVVGAPPSWLRSRFEWGWSPWPLTWSSAASLSSLDCGALAAISNHLISRRGYDVIQAQLLLRYSSLKCGTWRNIWKEPQWILGRFVYHEVVLINDGSAYRIWCPTDTAWINLNNRNGEDGRVIALRHFALSKLDLQVSTDALETLSATSGEWTII